MNTVTLRPLLRLDKVGKTYPRLSRSRDRLRSLWAALWNRAGGPAHTILQDIDLEVYRGESLGVVGENGAGKSTLLKIIAGVLTPNSGALHVDGNIGALLELGAGFHPEYTGRDNIRLAAALMGMPQQQADEKLASIIEFADIGHYIDEPIKHYSSGMVVRLGFAVVTAMRRPDLLITDEVLAVGDESFQKKCVRWLESYLNEGGTLLLCSHSMFHIQKLCNKACWIHHGRLYRYGDSFDVTQEYLAYHEEKSRQNSVQPHITAAVSEYRVTGLELQGADITVSTHEVELPMGDDLLIAGRLYSPDGRPPGVAVGILRGQDMPIYGVTSDIDGFRLNPLAENAFGFSLRLPNPPLLPGRYRLRVHALDPEGMRLFDTLERSFRIMGRSRELGYCRLPHVWTPYPQAQQTALAADASPQREGERLACGA